MSTQAFTGQLLELVLKAKDRVHAQHRRANEAFFELYERTGRLVALHLENPELAKKDIVELCNAEYALTGDCDALGDIAELLDPNGEFFWKQAEAEEARSFVVEDVDGELTLDGVLELVAKDQNAEHARELVVGEAKVFAATDDRLVTVTRVA